MLQCRVVKWSSILSAVSSILIKSLTAMVAVLCFFGHTHLKFDWLNSVHINFVRWFVSVRWMHPVPYQVILSNYMCIFKLKNINYAHLFSQQNLIIYLVNKIVINHVIVVSSLLLCWFNKSKRKNKRENSMRSIMTL